MANNNIAVTVDGIYDAKTAAAVRQFQSNKKLNLIDSIVDSETKSILALYWLNLYKNNTKKFQTLLDKAPAGVDRFIKAAIVYSDIEKAYDGSDSSEYRRISYTGVPGPTAITDHIVVEVPIVLTPSGARMPSQEIVSINIKAGEWPLGVKNIWMYTQDLAGNQGEVLTVVNGDALEVVVVSEGLAKDTHKVPEFNPDSIKASANNKIILEKLLSPNESYSIPIPSNENIKYVMIEVYGNSLNIDNTIYGPNSEGFSIRDINFSIKTPVRGKGAIEEETKKGKLSFKATGYGTISGKTDITSGDFGVFKLSSISDANAYPGSTIKEVRLNSLDIKSNVVDDEGNFILDSDQNPIEIYIDHQITSSLIGPNSSGEFNNEKIIFESDGVEYVVNALSESTGLSEINPSITSVYRTGGPTAGKNLTQSEINSQFSILGNMKPIYQVVTTNGVEIESREFSKEYNVSNFFVADADSSGLKYKQNKKLSINAKDGAVVLTDEFGNPVGLPDYGSFAQPQDTSTGSSIEISFGSTMIKWNLKDSNNQLLAAPDGLQWGFYNIVTRQFLGKKFSYQYYTRNKRDIYIGLIAFDADRNSITTDNIIGIDNRTGTLREFQFPAKSLCPIYSVRVSDRSKIAISSPPKDLSKFDNWFINLSRGRFFKKVSLSPRGIIPVTDWKKDYYGQTLKCFYDTTKIPIPSSDIFGSGYYDIMEENPIIVSRNEIQLRHGSFHVTQERLDKPNINTLYTDASPMEVWVDIFVKDKNNQWKDIDEKQIKTFNKHTGTIFFEKEIIPTNPKNIKVNYVVKNPNIMLNSINKKEIPTNPYVASINQHYRNNEGFFGVYQFAKNYGGPIYFYLLPSSVQVSQNGDYVNVSEYPTPSSVVEYSLSNSIFDPDSTDYNPFALYLGLAIVNNRFDLNNVIFSDLRIKGGGLSPLENTPKTIQAKSNIINFADLNSGKGYLYPRGGYVIVKIPKEVKNNFNSIDEVYSIVRSNLTAGIAFDIHDMDGNDWRSV